MLNSSTITHTAIFTVAPQTFNRYTTLLQSGIRLFSTTGSSIRRFLEELPGFDSQYINERVQTIFFDGSAIDNLDRPFSSSSHTLALSAAMPGLAGAIFRKNSLCGTLRTDKNGPAETEKQASTSAVQLKLFNSIAREKGENILREGCYIGSDDLIDFLRLRPSMLEAIRECEIDGRAVKPDQLLSRLQRGQEYGLIIHTGQKK